MRSLSWVGFYAAILLAWAMFFDMARDGGGFLCGPNTIKLLPMGGFVTLFSMWALMMAAMMLPTIIPTLRAYDGLPANTGADRAGWLGVILGYGFVWIAGAAGFAALQVAALSNGFVDLTGAFVSPWAAAALLMFAGAWQFTRTKEVCQDACLTPMQLFMSRWKPGVFGGMRMGLDIGVVCVGCCWAIMALAFVGGVMSLWWMGLATLFMVAEKLPQIGMQLRRPAGVALIGAGGYVALMAYAN